MTNVLAGLSIDSLTQDAIVQEILASYHRLGLSPDYYPSFAKQAAEQLSLDLDMTALAPIYERTTDLERESEFLDLQAHIQSSRSTLDHLTAFLSTFQSDLSTVSSSIAELQGRSKLLESRLESRRMVLSSLSPYISSTFLPPDLITKILQTEPSDSWIDPIASLELRLSSFRPSSSLAHPAVDIAQKLRLVAADKICTFFINALKPFRTSISANLQISQSSVFLKHQALFGFLQRHAARTAHQVQKAYVGTVRWYLETGLRRYVRALDKVKGRGWLKAGLIGTTGTTPIRPQNVIPHAFIEGPDIILAHMTEPATFKQAPEALFRSLSLVVADNVGTEYEFVKNFFGLHPSSDPIQSETFYSVARQPSTLPRPPPSIISSVAETTMSESSAFLDAQPALEHVWHQIVAPVLEYHRTFTAKLLETKPDTASLYAMIQLNEHLLTSSKNTIPRMETHLMSLKLLLWPTFQRLLHAERESLKALSMKSASGRAYGALVVTLVGMMTVGSERQEAEEEKVLGELISLRQLLDQAGNSKIWKEVVEQVLACGPTAATHPHLLTEVAHWKEMIRRSESGLQVRK